MANALMKKTLFVLMLGMLTACSSTTTAPVSDSWNKVDTTQTIHNVQPGETIYSIAWRYNVSDEDLIRWNHLTKPYYVQIGQRISLTPSADDTGSTAVAAGPETIAPTPTFTPESSAVRSKVPMTSSPKSAPAKTSVNKTTAPGASKSSATSSTTAMEGSSSGGWSWPVKGKVIENYHQNGNKGVDIAVAEGTPVKAVQPGSVVYAGDSLHGYGNLVIVKQKNDLMTAYAHNSKLMVKEGSQVTAGQTIALSGHTEAKTDSLHFEVRKAGKPVDPMNYLAKEQA